VKIELARSHGYVFGKIMIRNRLEFYAVKYTIIVKFKQLKGLK
jgi:hypothetical protein